MADPPEIKNRNRIAPHKPQGNELFDAESLLLHEEIKKKLNEISHVKNCFLRTNCERSRSFDEMDMEIYFKKEFRQVAGTYNARSALYSLLNASKKKVNGVITAVEEDALSLCHFAEILNIPVTIILSKATPLNRVYACEKYRSINTKVLVQGDHLQDAEDYAIYVAALEKLHYIKMPDIVRLLGCGSLATEIIEQVPDLDAVVIPFGGNDDILVKSVSQIMKKFKPSIDVIAVIGDNPDRIINSRSSTDQTSVIPQSGAALPLPPLQIALPISSAPTATTSASLLMTTVPPTSSVPTDTTLPPPLPLRTVPPTSSVPTDTTLPPPLPLRTVPRTSSVPTDTTLPPPLPLKTVRSTSSVPTATTLPSVANDDILVKSVPQNMKKFKLTIDAVNLNEAIITSRSSTDQTSAIPLPCGALSLPSLPLRTVSSISSMPTAISSSSPSFLSSPAASSINRSSSVTPWYEISSQSSLSESAYTPMASMNKSANVPMASMSLPQSPAALDEDSSDVDKIISVKDKWIDMAITKLFQKERCIIDRMGAIGLAACLSGQLKQYRKKRVVFLLTCGNLDIYDLPKVLERGLFQQGRLINCVVKLPDEPDSITLFCNRLKDTYVRVKQISYSRELIMDGTYILQTNVLFETMHPIHTNNQIIFFKNILAHMYPTAVATFNIVETPLSND